MLNTRFKLVGISDYGTPVLRIRNSTPNGVAVELHAVLGDFAWADTVAPGDTFVELPDGAAHVASTATGSRTLRPSARLPLHDGPIHKRAQRHATGLPRGTRVRTLFGAAAVENLRVGDPVLCRDKAHRSLRWIAQSGHGDHAVYYPLFGANTEICADGGWVRALGPERALRELPSAERDALLGANPQMRFKADRRPALPALDPAEFSYRIEMA